MLSLPGGPLKVVEVGSIAGRTETSRGKTGRIDKTGQRRKFTKRVYRGADSVGVWDQTKTYFLRGEKHGVPRAKNNLQLSPDRFKHKIR